MDIHEMGNEYTFHNVPRFDSYAEGSHLAYTLLVNKLSNKNVRVKAAKANKKAKAKKRMIKQSRKRNR